MTEKDDFGVFYPLKDMNDNIKNINPMSSTILLKQFFIALGDKSVNAIGIRYFVPHYVPLMGSSSPNRI